MKIMTTRNMTKNMTKNMMKNMNLKASLKRLPSNLLLLQKPQQLLLLYFRACRQLLKFLGVKIQDSFRKGAFFFMTTVRPKGCAPFCTFVNTETSLQACSRSLQEGS